VRRYDEGRGDSRSTGYFYEISSADLFIKFHFGSFRKGELDFDRATSFEHLQSESIIRGSGERSAEFNHVDP
jgi:hypothetical protein